MQYIEITQDRGGFSYAMSGPFEVGASFQGKSQKNPIGVDIIYEDHLAVSEGGKPTRIAPAVLMDGPNFMTTYRLIMPLDQDRLDALTFLKRRAEQPLGGRAQGKMAELLRGCFDEGLDLAGVKLPKTPLKDKVAGLFVALLHS